ncbi:putative nuclease HARBI1 [Colias croceus]|uniref:putative nuclease HARBI1 n=1 Tax=Colias crocea TaxID=72248 RepID=UPI001E27E380|nr:putative nuclease HARBI1 [Colias croceus]
MHNIRLLWAANIETTLQRRQTRINRRKMVQIVEMEELEFIHRFRLDKQSFWRLCDDLRCLTSLKGTQEISLEIKVLCTLRFLATGSYQRIVGLTQHLVQRTASRCIRQVVEALSHPAIINKWILFPRSQQQRAQIRLEFQRRFRLLGIVGCIDCTHVAIVKPSDDEHLFFNRKGYHSLNVQMVCDSNLKITNVNPKFGGATHDSFIWASSRMETFMRELHQNGEQVWLLGDSGYPQRPWLMTPILNAIPGSVEDTYTQRHVQARNCIECCFGLLKSRWRCLLTY